MPPCGRLQAFFCLESALSVCTAYVSGRRFQGVPDTVFGKGFSRQVIFGMKKLKEIPAARAIIKGSETYPDIKGKADFYDVHGGTVVFEP